MEELPSHKQMFLLFKSQHVSAQIGGHHQMILEKYKNDHGINVNYHASIKFCYLKSPDDGLSGPKHVVG
jgi:hypothetical protein